MVWPLTIYLSPGLYCFISRQTRPRLAPLSPSKQRRFWLEYPARISGRRGLDHRHSLQVDRLSKLISRHFRPGSGTPGTINVTPRLPLISRQLRTRLAPPLTIKATRTMALISRQHSTPLTIKATRLLDLIARQKNRATRFQPRGFWTSLPASFSQGNRTLNTHRNYHSQTQYSSHITHHITHCPLSFLPSSLT